VAVGARVDEPQWPTGWRWHGAADAARAHQSSAPHGYGAPFSGVFFLQNRRGARNSPRGLQPVGSYGARCAAARFKLEPSATVGGSSKGRLTTRLAKMGAAQDVEHHCRVDGAREASHAAR
jgi:hypothetical protein